MSPIFQESVALRDLKVWVGIALAVLTGIIVPACRDYQDVKTRLAIIENSERFLHGGIWTAPGQGGDK